MEYNSKLPFLLFNKMNNEEKLSKKEKKKYNSDTGIINHIFMVPRTSEVKFVPKE